MVSRKFGSSWLQGICLFPLGIFRLGDLCRTTVETFLIRDNRIDAEIFIERRKEEQSFRLNEQRQRIHRSLPRKHVSLIDFACRPNCLYSLTMLT